MKNHVLTIAAFIVATFAVQAISHFVLAAEHYAAIPYIRKEPIFAFGFVAMIIQGGVLSVMYRRHVAVQGSSIGLAIGFAWTMGAFLVSYMALAEAAKYRVPSIPSWVAVEVSSGLLQFGIFGGLLHLIYREGSTGR